MYIMCTYYEYIAIRSYESQEALPIYQDDPGN